MDKIIPCLWFTSNAEEAVNFYVGLFPNSRIDRILNSPTNTPSGPEGSLLTVEFTLVGRQYIALNGGAHCTPSEAVSFQIMCDNQDEIDRLWAALTEGGAPLQCGWLKDKWGFSWQIVPKRLTELLFDSDRSRARRAMEAMMTMVKLDISEIERAADSK